MKTNEINIWLMGGLGNQLFQLNKAYSLRRAGFNVNLVNNLISDKSYIAKNILQWKIHKNVLNEIYRLDFPIITKKNVLPVLFSRTEFFQNYACFCGIDYESLISKNMFGYFQHGVKINLHRTKFVSRRTAGGPIMHIRLSDANNLVAAKNYYVNAINKLQISKLNIVTDDLKGAEDLLMRHCNIQYEIISKSVTHDFNLLRMAPVVIAAPSTFSFWAAITNYNADQIIVPEIFNRFVKITPPNWIYMTDREENL